MAEHKFKIGERVYFNSRSRREVPPGPCQIVKRLPAANGEFQYIVRSEYKDHQHVAKGRRAKPLLVFPPCRRLSSLAIFAHAHWRHRMGGCLGRARLPAHLAAPRCGSADTTAPASSLSYGGERPAATALVYPTNKDARDFEVLVVFVVLSTCILFCH
jgi:hypothetical protein